MSGSELVFGYGSLVGVPERATVARLPGFRRRLGVAMDNAVDLPGYKWYRDPRDGSRPDVLVAFADLAEAPGGPPVNGVLLAPPDLGALDARERNYERVDVTGAVEGAPRGAWVSAYLGSAAARARFEDGRRDDALVVARAYVESVQAGFRALGPEEHRAFLESTDFGGVPVMALERIDLP